MCQQSNLVIYPLRMQKKQNCVGDFVAGPNFAIAAGVFGQVELFFPLKTPKTLNIIIPEPGSDHFFQRRLFCLVKP